VVVTEAVCDVTEAVADVEVVAVGKRVGVMDDVAVCVAVWVGVPDVVGKQSSAGV